MGKATQILKVVVLAVLGFGVLTFFLQTRVLYSTARDAKPVGNLRTYPNAAFQANIDRFMAAKISSPTVAAGCRDVLFGHDDKFGYAWVDCRFFVEKDSETLEPAGSIARYVRFEHNSNFEVTDFRQPEPGGDPEKSLRKLFPRKIAKMAHPSEAQIQNLEEEIVKTMEESTGRRLKRPGAAAAPLSSGTTDFAASASTVSYSVEKSSPQ